MIQRIQTLFMALASISALLLFFFPIAEFLGSVHILKLYVFKLKEFMPGASPLIGSFFVLPLIILTVIMVLLPVIAIFKYKKMNVQYKFMRANMFLTIVVVAAILLYYTPAIAKLVQVEANYEIGAFLPLLALVFSILAMRSIRSDIKLIRSVDRIR